MSEALNTLASKYEAASKDYQTQLTNAIKIPLLVYSGRIIQNYPLGLGIRAVVRTNQLAFEAASKNGNDVYNILSTGQLNGLSIAFLLSIKNVYGQTDGLDILLIDYFEIYKSNICHLVKDKGDMDFIIDILKDNVPRYLVIDFSKAEHDAVASNEDVSSISKRLIEKNKESCNG